MRIRNVKDAHERLAAHYKVIKEPELNKGKWHQFFKNDNPIKIEIGMGKGQFISRTAGINPEINFIGFEKYSSVLVRAIDKIDSGDDYSNLFLIRDEAENIMNIFGENELDGLYLNFSDPWPKERHEKRRLTYIDFLKRYAYILKPGSSISFKTDNKSLFEFSLEQIKECGFKIEELTYDLHNSNYAENNIMTEYEEKFVTNGMSINYVRFLV